MSSGTSNPLNLPGPQFLVFYLALAAVTIALLVVSRRAQESGEASTVSLSDPYLVACLRGGANEAMRVAAAAAVGVAVASAADRVGIGWRPELAAGILSHLDRIDVVEVIADDYFDAPQERLRALRTLSRHVPLVLHGVSLGLASAIPVDPRRLRAMACLVRRCCR